MKKYYLKIIGLLSLAVLFSSCQNLDRPELGDYPSDKQNYTPKDGEKLYVPFENTFFLNLFSGAPASKVGNSSLGSPKVGKYSYMGAADSYISYPVNGLYSDAGISFAFWYKVNAVPDRAGIITINDNTNDADENRNQGLRIFREGDATKQRIKLNLGISVGDSYNDGAELDANGNWVYVVVTVAPTTSKIYFDGVLKNTATYSHTFDFSTSTKMVVGSGGPSFSYYNHKSDLSLIDELRVFNKVLSPADIQNLMQ